jgi:hypothetical protein
LPNEEVKSEVAHKAWGTRRARKAAATRKKNMSHVKLSKTARTEVASRKHIQELVAPSLREWWRSEFLDGSKTRTKPRKCEVCGETEELGLAIHHIDPRIQRADRWYNLLQNKAPLCGTCHNIITYKKTKDSAEIEKVLKSRHENALRTGLLKP